jgi:small subunit ribosomal protein S8
MAQDIVSDALNQIMNRKNVEKNEIKIKRISKLLIKLLEIMKKKGHIDFEQNGNEVTVKVIDLNECKTIKPRYPVTVAEIEKFQRRFLPSRNFGTMIVSTSKGLMTQYEAMENKIGGSLIAYFY